MSHLAEMPRIDILESFLTPKMQRFTARVGERSPPSTESGLAELDRQSVQRNTLPSTEAPGGRGTLDTRGWLQEGLLAFMDYRVGSTNGAPTRTRRALLAAIFTGHLPPVFPPDYLDEWGQPGSAVRLKKWLSPSQPLRALPNASRAWVWVMRFAIGKMTCDSSMRHTMFVILGSLGRHTS